MAHLITYDIENDKLRTSIAKIIIGKGAMRVQKSVFYADLSAQQTSLLFEALKAMQEELENGDNIVIIPLFESMLNKMVIIGQNPRLDEAIRPPNSYVF
jgi:CRISPR-associated protein Cas2